MEKVRCPRCKEWASYKKNTFRPFCSKECKEKDLGDWATERYRIAKEEQDAGIVDLDIDTARKKLSKAGKD